MTFWNQDGKIAYQAFREAVGVINCKGERLKDFSLLPINIQNAWSSAYTASVIHHRETVYELVKNPKHDTFEEFINIQDVEGNEDEEKTDKFFYSLF